MDVSTIETQLRRSLFTTAAIAVGAFAAYFIWFGLVLGEPLSDDTGTWGELGDFIGGLMNPIVAGCALYWLAMSVRLQKQELSDTRKELAEASAAQREQARMALLGIQLNSLSMQLNSLTTELGHVQERLSYVERRMDSYQGYGQPAVFDIEAGERVPALALSGALEDRMNHLQAEKTKLLLELEQINDLALAKQISTVGEPHAPT